MDRTYIKILYELSLVLNLNKDERKVINDFSLKCISRLNLMSAGVLVTDKEAKDFLGYTLEVIPTEGVIDKQKILKLVKNNNENCLRLQLEEHFLYLYKMEKVGYFFMVSRFDYLGENFDMLFNIIKRLTGSILFSIQYKQLNKAKKEAESANRVKSDFMATMNHEIRTPLNTVVTASNLLKNTKLTNEQLELLSLINFSSDTVLSIINSSLEYTKIDRNEMELENINFNLKESISKIIKMLEVSYAHNSNKVKLSSKNFPDLIVSDYNLLNQVLLNVIGNAFKFTRFGNINVDIKLSKDSFVEVSIEDTGIGMSKRTLGKIFDLYNQGNTSIRRKFGGTGLGLAICKKIISLMGGSIDVVSKKGKGSTFIIKFPYQKATELSKEIESKISHDFEKLNIVIVEDNIINSKLLRKVLELKKMNVKCFSSPLEAEMYITQNYNNIDLIFMDISMPEVDGFTLTKRIRKQLKESIPKVVALTANSSINHKTKAKACKMVDFVEKPFQFQDVYDVIRKHTS